MMKPWSYGGLTVLCLIGCKTGTRVEPLAWFPRPGVNAPATSLSASAVSTPPAESTATSEAVAKVVAEPVVKPEHEITPVAFQAPDTNQLPAPNTSPIPVQVADPPLELANVKSSVVASFPGLQIARRELDIARGKETAAWGEFDLKLKGESVSAPEGFYENYRQLVKLEQATMPGGTVYGQYRLGDGSFPAWYGERETNEGGEFKIGMLAALLRDRAIDQRRATIFQAQLQQRQVEPAVQSLLLEFVLAASDSYWSWVAAGQSFYVQRDLLNLTIDRNRIYELRVKNQDLAPLELVQNQRLVAARQTKLIEAERKLQQSAIKLSFFYRDAAGRPLQPTLAQLPPQFPTTDQLPSGEDQTEVQQALANRPELQELRILRQQVAIDYQLAENQYLPAINAGLDASKDVGAAASSKGDKTPFEREAGLFVDVPYQRRKAVGKMREAQAKLAQLAHKTELTSNKIEVQVRDARSAIITAQQRVVQARESRRLADELVAGERLRFENKDSDLLRVALQESSALEAALAEIEAITDYHKALAAYDAAMGLLP